MTVSDLILLAAKRGYAFDEVHFSNTGSYKFVTTFDGYSASSIVFDTAADATRYFMEER